MEQNDLEQIFMEAFETYGDAIYRFCVFKVSEKERAEDFTQEVFMRYWQALREGKEMTNTRSYLYTIAHNLAKDWYKKKKSLSLDAHMENGHEPEDARGERAELFAQYHEVRDALSLLEERDQEVLLLRFVEGLEPKDIAAIINESANVVSVRINRAVKRLQQHLHI